ncbi:6-phosphofructo-2-kinase/fructose-2,6-bisphosphatase [Platanthera guangdongensis]|uniref:6-phosphofructo-2-kinase/fructose-2, 6-bisphosphatase n=1 Tax=Platanthera guangdongensis TaxID=2320717 RepID=A0ABR2M990_9ASPA
MGGSSSRSPSISHASVGGQLYVSLKMEYFKIGDELIPHVFGSVPIIGSWDPARAVRHQTLHFLFLLKPDERDEPCVVEEGPDRLLTRGNLEGDARAAIFRPPELGNNAIPEYKIRP